MVVAAVAASALCSDQSLREALSSVRSMLGTGWRGLAVTSTTTSWGWRPS